MRTCKNVLVAILFFCVICGVSKAAYNPSDPNQIVLNSWDIVAEASDYLNWTAQAGIVEDSRDPHSPGDGLDSTGMLHYNGPFANYQWLSAARKIGVNTAGAWIKLTLPAVYKVKSLLIWNHGQTSETNPRLLGRGMHWVKIEYSLDNVNWTLLGIDGVYELTDAPDNNNTFYPYTDDVDFGEVQARYIRITANALDDPIHPGTFDVSDGHIPSFDPLKNYFFGLAQATIVYTGVTAEPAYVPTQMALTRDQVTATSSGDLSVDNLPATMVNHAGITDPRTFEHEANDYALGMWVSIAGGGGIGFVEPGVPHEGRAWVRFNFDQVQNLGIMSIWNCKQKGQLGRGLKKVYVDYTADGTTWHTLMNGANGFFILASGTSTNGGPDNHIDFGGIAAQSVVITADEFAGNYGDITPYYALSEVRFGLAGTQWPGDPNYPSQNIITHDKITVSIPSDPNIIGGESFWLVDNTGLGSNFRHIADKFGVAMLQYQPSGNSAAVPGKTVVGAAWFRFDFDTAYNLGKMRVWNLNQIGGSYPWDNTDRGLRNVTIQYTGDGTNWSTLGSFEIPQAVAEDEAAANKVIDFAGVAARSVVITASDNWGGSAESDYGLSQVEFGIQGTTFGYGIAELQAMAAQWLNTGIVGGDCIGTPGWDLDGDCDVDMADFNIAAKRWLLSN